MKMHCGILQCQKESTYFNQWSVAKKMCADTKNQKQQNLRAIAATLMLEKGAPEKLIQEHTGNHNLQSLHSFVKCAGRLHSNLH